MQVVATPEQIAAALIPPDEPLPPHLRDAGDADSPHTGRVAPATLGVWLCEAVLQGIALDKNGAVLALGRKVRTATTAQRTALAVRDRGCVITGCTIPAAWCDAHHVKWWSRGGGTDIRNLAFLCHRHHKAVHAGMWSLEMRDGVPWVIPPPWVDPDRMLRRNPVWQALDDARSLGRQLRFDL